MDSETAAPASRLDIISRVMDKTLSYVVAMLMIAMSGIVFGNVICRYFLQASLGWYEEVSRFMLIWIVFLGAVIALIKGDHIGIDFMLLLLPLRARRVVVVLTDLLLLAALAVMLQGAWRMAVDSLESGWLASSVPIPYGWVYMVGPVSAGLMIVQTLIKTAGDVRTMMEALR